MLFPSQAAQDPTKDTGELSRCTGLVVSACHCCFFRNPPAPRLGDQLWRMSCYKGSSGRVQGFCSLGYHGGSTVKSARLAGGEPTQADPPGSAHCLLELHHHYHHHYPTPPHHHHHHHPLPHPTTPGSLCPRGTYPQSSWILATLG